MIRQNQSFFNVIMIFLDMLVITFSLILAWYIRFETDLLGFGHGTWGFDHYMSPLLIILPMYLLLYYIFGLYTPQRTKKSIRSELFQIIKVNIIGLLVLVALLFVLNLTDYSRFLLAMFAIFSIGFSTLERYTIRQGLQYIRSKGYNLKHILVVGAGDLGEKFANKLMENDYVGYEIIGFLDDNIEKGQKVVNSEIIGKIIDLEPLLLTKEIDRVIITLSPRHRSLLEAIVDLCEKHGVKADIIPDYYRYFRSKPYIDMIDDIPLMNIRRVPLDNSYNMAIKRILDTGVAILAIIITSPIMIITAVIIKITSPGPIIYKQERVGLDRKNFMMYKFRSMKVQDEEEEKFQWTTEDDPRKTRFGSFIRRTSIDELPQFFNILKGDMSLIGPRPERPHFVEKFREEIPKYMIKHHVRPGMTGWAQVNGWRGDTSIEKRIDYDMYYVENWTLMLDLKIFFMTFRTGFTDKHAY
ncbi:MAG: undecaprenyl-phosphate glucose phosphotransferase [Methanobacterium sp. BRmetb2]|nr:MAG: undecaprenyl-phosphate glucose phosphotransferase [Methanobacterium sp. BRmetb2]